MPRHFNDGPLLNGTVEIEGTAMVFVLEEDGLTLTDDSEPPTFIEMRPKTREEAARMAMALRLAMRRMNAIAERFGA